MDWTQGKVYVLQLLQIKSEFLLIQWPERQYAVEYVVEYVAEYAVENFQLHT